MTSPAAALEFFVTEASGYIDGLDNLFSTAGPAGPDREAFVRLARALRGNSTMYRQPAISRVASALERVARSLRDGTVTWNPRLSAALVAAVDDLRILLRNVRAWGPADDQRAQARAAELEMMAPSSSHAPTPPVADAGREFLAAKTREVAAALDRVTASPGDRGAVSALLRSVRGLNGIAALREHAALTEVGGTVERIAQGAELAAAAPATGDQALLRSAAAVLHRAAAEISAGRRMDAQAPELGEYARQAGAAPAAAPRGETVLPIGALFHDDAGPHVVRAAEEPPTPAGARFRLEIVTHAEHLRRLLADARDALDPASRERAARDLRRELDAIVSLSVSYAEGEVSAFFADWRERVVALERAALDALDAVLALLADPAAPRASLLRALDRLAPDAAERPVTPAPAGAPAAPQPAPAAVRPGALTPSGRELRTFLAEPISEISLLGERPLTPPLPLPQEEVVPISELLYRGQGALRRARQLRDGIRAGALPPSAETLEEIYDLLDLATAE